MKRRVQKDGKKASTTSGCGGITEEIKCYRDREQLVYPLHKDTKRVETQGEHNERPRDNNRQVRSYKDRVQLVHPLHVLSLLCAFVAHDRKAKKQG